MRAARTQRDFRFWLQVTAGILACLNLVALTLYLSPPGGTRRELSRQSLQMRYQAQSLKNQKQRLKLVASRVEGGNKQAAGFETVFFLPKRAAYSRVLGELERIAKASGLEMREGAYAEEPIEGTPDLTLLNLTANFDGTYDNLMKFLNETDHSPMLIMLDSMTAAPQQKNGHINTTLRFQTVIREDGTNLAGLKQ